MSTMTHPTNGNPEASKERSPLQNLSDMLHKSKSQIALALPKHLTPERMIRVALTAFSKTPALQECTPRSIVGAVVQASELGLELSGVLGHAYLVPYWNKNVGAKEAQFQVGYRGLLELAHRSGRVKCFYAHEVYEKDRFSFSYGTDPKIDHVPLTAGDRGQITHVYAVCIQKSGGVDFEVMSRADIDAHRKRYAKSQGGSPWDTAWPEMAKKTVIRKLAKRVPLSVELTKAAVLDETAEAGMTAAALIEQPMQTLNLPSGRMEIKDLGTDAEPGATEGVSGQTETGSSAGGEGDGSDSLEADATFGELSEMVRQADTAKARDEARTAIAAAEDKIGSLRMTQLIDTLDAGAKKKSK